MRLCGGLLPLPTLLLVGCRTEPEAADNPVTEYQQRYQAPLRSPGTQFASLPPAVQHTVRAESGTADIDTIVKSTTVAGAVYEIHFMDYEMLPALYVANDGSVLNPDLTLFRGAPSDLSSVLTGSVVSGLALGELPPVVVKSIQQHAPAAEISSISKEARGDYVVYVIRFKNQMHPILYLTPDGAVAKEPLQ